MKTLTAEELRNNIKTLNVDYISGLSKKSLLYCADIIQDIKVKKSDNKLNIVIYTNKEFGIIKKEITKNV